MPSKQNTSDGKDRKLTEFKLECGSMTLPKFHLKNDGNISGNTMVVRRMAMSDKGTVETG